MSPGNDGIAAVAACVRLGDITDPEAVSSWVAENPVDLVVIGPEAPLVTGVADALRGRGVPVFGPGRAAARLEGSKTFAKRIMSEAGVPTGRAIRAATYAEAIAALDELGTPHVVKADGLAAGKGVLVTEDRAAALAHAERYLELGSVLVEEHLTGQEVSLFFLADGSHVLPLSPAQDYKRLGDGDAGPNTGGMGAYAQLPWAPEDLVERVLTATVHPTLAEMRRRGTRFAGLL